jgi:phosphoribosylformimino-5-aminoimidazole carboxamide ribotide isomerase
MRIIPAIDIIDGKCVRLHKGDYALKKVYNDNPASVAKEFDNAGLPYLHLVDLDGAKAGKVINWEVLGNITKSTNLIVDFGGGVKTREELVKLFDNGVSQVNLGSIAVRQPDMVAEWIEEFGAGKIILSADAKNEKVAITGWTEDSGIDLIGFISGYVTHGLTHVTCTDIDTDGTLAGPNVTLYKKLVTKFPELKVIASGGVGTVNDLISLKSTGVDGVIIGKAFYEGRISLQELKQMN